MNPPRVYKVEAVVLRQRRLGEADKIVTLFSAEYGKFDAVAKGIRRAVSRKAGHLEPLTRASLLIARGRSLDIITQAEAVDAYAPLRADVRRLAAGLYIAELVDRFSPEQAESEGLYRLFIATLGRIASAGDIDTALRFFEMRLLVEAGYQPELFQCAGCGVPLRAEANAFNAATGGAVCPTCLPPAIAPRPLSVNALKVLRAMLQRPYAEFARLRLSHELMLEIEAVLRAALRVHLERDLQTLPFLQSARRQEPTRAPAVLS